MYPQYRRRKTAAAAGLHTRTGWNELGQSVMTGAQVDAWYRSRYGIYCLYAEDKTKPKRILTPIPPVRIDLLKAMFVVTRAAKRFRDAAASCYRDRRHAFAMRNREIKEECYEAKDRGLLFALRAGRISPVAVISNLTVYQGEGYCFHSPLRPMTWTPPPESVIDDELPVIDAKTKEASEPRLKDALFTLQALPLDERGFVRIPFPQREPEEDEGEPPWKRRWQRETSSYDEEEFYSKADCG